MLSTLKKSANLASKFNRWGSCLPPVIFILILSKLIWSEISSFVFLFILLMTPDGCIKSSSGEQVPELNRSSLLSKLPDFSI